MSGSMGFHKGTSKIAGFDDSMANLGKLGFEAHGLLFAQTPILRVAHKIERKGFELIMARNKLTNN